MKHFVIILQYIKPLDEIDKYLHEHRAYLDKGYTSQLLLASGPQNPRSGGIILAKAKTVEEIKSFCNSDPFNIHGCAEYTIVEFIPVKYQKEFRDWFAGDLHVNY